jgi:D-arabinitol 4-dehydrogenase
MPVRLLSEFVILHLGLGSFHRAHQAVYLQQLIEAGDARWSLSGANLRPDMAELLSALRAQDGCYTVETVSPAGDYRYQHIGAIREVLAWEPSLAAVVARGADPRTRIVSFTVTEAGYYLDPQDRLDMADAELAEDLARARRGEAGQTIYGAICAILRARSAAAHAGPVTLLNCDNLRHNGERFRRGLLEFIERAGLPTLASWVRENTTCPNAMVDRITPRPPPELRRRVREATGCDDAAPVTAERFSQWVIEDDFIHGRPDWARVGVELVDSVAPFEEAKIRILNASHSCIAWAGTLIGLQYIHEGTHTPAIRQMAFDYVTDDVIPCLNRGGHPSPVDLPAYRDVVLERFGNPAIRDTNQRVAMDGFSKIPGFIAPTVRERLAHGERIDGVAMLPALFLAFLRRWHQGTLPYAYQDQGMDPATAHAICDAADPVAALCADTGLWGDTAGDMRLEQAVRDAGARVRTLIEGARA